MTATATLLPHHEQLLRASAIAPEVAAARGYRSVTTRAELARLGFGSKQQQVPTLLIPIWDVTGSIATYQHRPDQPRVKDGKPIKYETLAGSRMVLDVHPLIRAQLADPAIPLVVTEGVRKSDSAVTAGLCCIALLGVWSWRGRNQHDGKTALPDWEAIALDGRQVFVCYDSDVMCKREVHQALARLGAFLRQRGADVAYIYLPPGPGGAKVGLDDYLAAGHSVAELFGLATRELRRPPGEDAARADTRRVGPYEYGPAGTAYVRTTAHGSEAYPLANFTARIAEVVTLDDDAEPRRVFRVEGRLGDRALPPLQVSAESFASMGWVAQWAPAAVIAAGTAAKDRLREAVLLDSGAAPERTVYTHAGWRQCAGAWVFLHGRGALGPDGPVEGIHVELPPQLHRYWLPDPPRDPEVARRAWAVLLAGVRVADLRITAPLFGAAFAAPLGLALGAPPAGGGLTVPGGFTLWLLAPTGFFKSTLSALVSHLFGGPWDDKGPPATWEASENALERLGHAAAYLPLWIDDFRPGGTGREALELERRAQRFIREVGNAAGRERMRADTSLRPSLWPRCLPICSGELLPGGASTVARLLVVDVVREWVDLDRLSEAQRLAPEWYPLAGALLVQAIAREAEALRAALPARRIAVRDQLRIHVAHPQHAAHAARLILAWGWVLEQAAQVGALSAAEAEALFAEVSEAIAVVAARSGQYGEAERPALRCLDLLQAMLRSRRVHISRLLPGDNEEEAPPTAPTLWGWTSPVDGPPTPGGPCVGYLDEAEGIVYLLPTPLLRELAEYTRTLPRRFAVTADALGRDLAAAGLLVKRDPGRHTYRKRIGLERPHTWALLARDIWADREGGGDAA